MTERAPFPDTSTLVAPPNFHPFDCAGPDQPPHQHVIPLADERALVPAKTLGASTKAVLDKFAPGIEPPTDSIPPLMVDGWSGYRNTNPWSNGQRLRDLVWLLVGRPDNWRQHLETYETASDYGPPHHLWEARIVMGPVDVSARSSLSQETAVRLATLRLLACYKTQTRTALRFVNCPSWLPYRYFLPSTDTVHHAVGFLRPDGTDILAGAKRYAKKH